MNAEVAEGLTRKTAAQLENNHRPYTNGDEVDPSQSLPQKHRLRHQHHDALHKNDNHTPIQEGHSHDSTEHSQHNINSTTSDSPVKAPSSIPAVASPSLSSFLNHLNECVDQYSSLTEEDKAQAQAKIAAAVTKLRKHKRSLAAPNHVSHDTTTSNGNAQHELVNSPVSSRSSAHPPPSVYSALHSLLSDNVDASQSLGFILADCNQRITHVNSAFESFTGYSKQDCIGKNCNFLQGRDTSLAAKNVMRKAIVNKESIRLAVLNYRKDGQPFWNLLTISPMLDFAGNVTHYIGLQIPVIYVDRPMPLFPWRSTQNSHTHTMDKHRYIDEDSDNDSTYHLNGQRRLLRHSTSMELGEQSLTLLTRKSSLPASASDTDLARAFNIPATPVTFIAETNLPTRLGTYQVRAYADRSVLGISEQRIIIVIVYGNVTQSTAGDASPIPLRVHDQCFTSEVLGSLKCDCRQQLDYSMHYIQHHSEERATHYATHGEKGHPAAGAALEGTGCGVIIYLAQEGRGIGLANKIKAYEVQEKGHDTKQANRLLGFPDDAREYTCLPSILADLQIHTVALMTNNPRKIEMLQKLRVNIADRLPVVMAANQHSHHYLHTKKHEMGHLYDDMQQSNGSG